MLELEELLREELRAAAGEAVPSDRLDTLVRRRVRRARRRRRGARVVAVALAALALPLAWLALSGGPTNDVAAGPPAADLGGVVFLRPTRLPGDLRLVGAAGGTQPGVRAWDGTMTFTKFPEGGSRDLWQVNVLWRSLPAGGDPLATFRTWGTPTTVRGATAVRSAAEGWIAFVDSGDRVVFVHGADAAVDRPLGPDLMGALVAQLAPGSAPFDPARAQLAGFHRWGSAAYDADTNARAIAYTDGRGRGLLVRLADTADPGRDPKTYLEPSLLETVRKQAAIVGDDVILGGLWPEGVPPRFPRPDLALQWIEPGGTRVILVGAGLSRKELVAIGDSLLPMSAGDWLALLDGSGSDDVAAPTASTPATTPPTTPATPPSTAAIPGATSVAGTYHGTEHYALTTGRCPDLDQVLDETLTLADGTPWRLHEDYCGELGGTGDRYRGNGTFTLTTPGGDTLTGTFAVDWTPAPSDGVPYTLEITGGTGAYAGARGSCTLDERITRIVIGVQDHDGTFVCTISPP